MIRGGVMGVMEWWQRPPTQATVNHQDATTDDARGVTGGCGGGQRPPTQATAYHQDSTTDGAGGVMGGLWGGETPRPPTRIACLSPALNKSNLP